MKILKKVVVVICCLVIGVGCTITSWAGELNNIKKYLEELNVIDKDSFRTDEGVYRIEAVPAIMKVFGVRDENVSSHPYFVSPPFADLGSRWVSEISNLEEGYVLNAVGIDMIQGYGGKFYPFNTITADEAVAIMVRFIEQKTIYHDDWHKLEYTHRYAQEAGLFLETDRFYENGNVAVTIEEFETLLYRLTNQPAFWYFNDGQYYDYERSRTYVELLQGDFPEERRMWSTQAAQGIFPGDERYEDYDIEKESKFKD